VLPSSKLIPLATFERLIALARAGATIVVHKGLPEDVPGLGNLARRRSQYRQLSAGLQFTETGQPGIRKANVGRGWFVTVSDLSQLGEATGVSREALTDGGLEFVRRNHPQGRIYFVHNAGKEGINGWVPLGTAARSAAIFDPMTGGRGIAALRREDGKDQIFLQLASGGSCIVKTFNTAISGPSFAYRTTGDAQMIRGRWSVRFTEGGPDLPAALEAADLGSWTGYAGEAVKRFSGTAVYTIMFDRPMGTADDWLLDLGRVCESARVRLNGQELGTQINAPYRIRVPNAALRPVNRLEIAVTNLMANRIADMDRRGLVYKRFYNINMPARRPENRGPDGLFTASRWPPRDSGLIGPVTLAPMNSLMPSR
jgi:hypothetical protein